MKARITTLALSAAFSSFALAQGTLHITFDGPPLQPPDTQYGVTEYSESGLLFTPIGPSDPHNQFSRNGGGISGQPNNGSPFLQAASDDSLQFRLADSSPFN